MLRDDRKENPMYDKPIYEKPVYENPMYDNPMNGKPMPERPMERPMYEDFDYSNCPMMPMYPNNMRPCPYCNPYPERDMYGDRRMDLEEMMRRNPKLRRCIMECMERYSNSNNPCNPCNPCNPRPMPKKRMKRNPYLYGLEEYHDYDSIEAEAEIYIEESEIQDIPGEED